jgi:hypothetical protein
MGIEQIRMNQTKALPPVPQFNWSQMSQVKPRIVFSGYWTNPVPGLYLSGYRGGLNGSAQHSARTHFALKTKDKSAR